MDVELELGVIVGQGGKNLDPKGDEAHIAGFCIMNDWSPRDLQHREMHVTPICPSKCKDFANGFGPCMVTPDEFEGRRKGVAYDHYDGLSERAGVRSSLARRHLLGIGEMLSYASREAMVAPGDIIGSGTCARGCIWS